MGTPEKRARGPISPKLDPKSRKHSELVWFLHTVQGLRCILVRNEQPCDLSYCTDAWQWHMFPDPPHVCELEVWDESSGLEQGFNAEQITGMRAGEM